MPAFEPETIIVSSTDGRHSRPYAYLIPRHFPCFAFLAPSFFSYAAMMPAGLSSKACLQSAAADVIGLALIGDRDRAFAAGDDAFDFAGPFHSEARARAGVADFGDPTVNALSGSLFVEHQ